MSTAENKYGEKLPKTRQFLYSYFIYIHVNIYNHLLLNIFVDYPIMMKITEFK